MKTTLEKLSVMTMPWPTDWSQVFGRERPLILEIGFGRGSFLLHLARTFPEHNVVGIEISNRCLVNAEEAVARHRLPNVRPVHAMAETALHHLFVPDSLEQVHINFPDPWFRIRHSHRRLMQRDTLDAVVSRLQPGGLLYLATDILEYAEMSHELLSSTPGLDNLVDGPWAASMPGRIVTKYEGKARREGRDCYYFAYRRNQHPAPNIPVIQEQPMPHVVFSSPITLSEIASAFAFDTTQVVDETYINFLRLWRSDPHFMFEVHIKEPTIEQRLALVLSARDDQRYTLQLSSLGHPRPTAGVHHAVHVLSDWLLGLHPEARLITRKLQEDEDEA